MALASATACFGFGHGQELRRSGFLGVVAVPIPKPARRANETGIMVQALVDGGSAKAAGIQANDIIVQVNEHQIIDVNDFVQTARTLRAGDVAIVHLRRGDSPKTIEVPANDAPVAASGDGRRRHNLDAYIAIEFRGARDRPDTFFLANLRADFVATYFVPNVIAITLRSPHKADMLH